jgi:transketolase
MRKKFANFLHQEMGRDEKVMMLTGDLGYGLWDKIKIDYPDRFINFASSEQLMIGAAAGLAMEGMKPYVYSITPFLLYRPFEFIRNQVDHENLRVKLVGGGRGKDYGYLGFTHWSEDDLKVISCFKNIKSFVPGDNLDDISLIQSFREFADNISPSYLSLKK